MGRLTDSPVVVVTSQFGYSAQQEKVMKAQSFQNKDQISMMSGRKTLEVNPNHPVIVDLLSKVKGDKEDKASLDTAQVLFQTALIESGYEIADPSALVNRVYRLMSKELGVDPDAPLKEIEVPEDAEEEKRKRTRTTTRTIAARKPPTRMMRTRRRTSEEALFSWAMDGMNELVHVRGYASK